MEDYTYHSPRRRPRCSGRTCSRSARRSRRAGLRSKSTPSRSAARTTRSGSCSTPATGPALNACLIDLGSRFRLMVNEVDRGGPPLLCRNCRSRARCGNASPTSRRPAPPGILAGRRASYGLQLQRDPGIVDDFAAIAGIELAAIGPETSLTNFKQDLRNNDVYYYLAQGFRA